METTRNPQVYLDKVKAFRENVFKKIAARDKERVWLTASLKDVRKVVIINSAPRCGSSFLFSLLRKITGVYSLSGEATPFYKLNGFSPEYPDSDEIPADLAKKTPCREDFSRDLLSDFSLGAFAEDIVNNDILRNDYLDNLILRFSLQWPVVDFSYDALRKIIIETFSFYRRVNKRFNKEKFYLGLLRRVRAEYPEINPYYYDIPEHLIKEAFPEVEIPAAPPNDILMIEEPPFILLSPRRKVKKEDILEETLILKSSIDTYRMDWMRNIFPNARLKIIYLVRNPLASINGLYDGWLYRGFFSHNLKSFLGSGKVKLRELRIKSYSDRYEWARWWWKYDLPRGWQDYAQRSLEEVCAFQWYSAQECIHKYLADNKASYCLIKYEDIIKDLNSRFMEIEKIINFIGMAGKVTAEKLGLEKMPVVQATRLPRAYRWQEKKDILLPLLDNRRISSMAERFGYDKENPGQWR